MTLLINHPVVDYFPILPCPTLCFALFIKWQRNSSYHSANFATLLKQIA